MKKWYVRIYLKGQNKKYGGYFKDELDAAKRVNQLCEELEIPLLNPKISAMPNQQYQVIKKFVLSHSIVRKS
jgi:6-pyruvoyl-tetrahydropterin synthase